MKKFPVFGAVKPVITIGRIGIGPHTIRDPPPTVSGGFVSSDGRSATSLWAPWMVIPILIDGKEVVALSLVDARRFARALLGEVET